MCVYVSPQCYLCFVCKPLSKCHIPDYIIKEYRWVLALSVESESTFLLIEKLKRCPLAFVAATAVATGIIAAFAAFAVLQLQLRTQLRLKPRKRQRNQMRM